MSIALAFWIVYLIGLVLCFCTSSNRWAMCGNLIFFILVGLLGWHCFGDFIHK